MWGELLRCEFALADVRTSTFSARMERVAWFQQFRPERWRGKRPLSSQVSKLPEAHPPFHALRKDLVFLII